MAEAGSPGQDVSVPNPMAVVTFPVAAETTVLGPAVSSLTEASLCRGCRRPLRPALVQSRLLAQAGDQASRLWNKYYALSCWAEREWCFERREALPHLCGQLLDQRKHGGKAIGKAHRFMKLPDCFMPTAVCKPNDWSNAIPFTAQPHLYSPTCGPLTGRSPLHPRPATVIMRLLLFPALTPPRRKILSCI